MPAALLAAPLAIAAPDERCWAKTGIWGNRTCPELEGVAHCRNCPVYSSAAAQMLDGEVTPAALEEWTKHFATPKITPDRDTHPIIIFRVNTDWLALPVPLLVEIAGRSPVHSLPHARNNFVKGLVNVRGRLLICISLTKLLHLSERAEEEKARHTTFERLLVVATPEGRLVFPVSEVFNLCSYGSAALRRLPATVARCGTHFAKALLPWRILRRGERGMPSEDVQVGLLDENLLFSTLNQNLA
jgi:chemotaxis-related protein WspD